MLHWIAQFVIPFSLLGPERLSEIVEWFRVIIVREPIVKIAKWFSGKSSFLMYITGNIVSVFLYRIPRIPWYLLKVSDGRCLNLSQEVWFWKWSFWLKKFLIWLGKISIFLEPHSIRFLTIYLHTQSPTVKLLNLEHRPWALKINDILLRLKTRSWRPGTPEDRSQNAKHAVKQVWFFFFLRMMIFMFLFCTKSRHLDQGDFHPLQ